MTSISMAISQVIECAEKYEDRYDPTILIEELRNLKTILMEDGEGCRC